MKFSFWILFIFLSYDSYSQKSVIEEPKISPEETKIDDLDPRFMLIRNARNIKYDRKKIVAHGDLRCRYKGYDILADYATGDTELDQYILEGNVLAISKDKTISAEKMKIDFKAKTVRFIKGQSELNPDFLQGNFVDDLYIKSLTGGGSEKEFECEYCDSTTCRAEHPHYQLKSRTVNIIPKKRAVLKDVDLWFLNNRLLHLPILVIPLDEHSYRYFPEFGYNSYEGYYIKSNIGFPVEEDLFILKTDYFSRIGFGTGGEYHYESEEKKGKLEAYSLLHDRSINGRINHKENIDKGIFQIDIAFSRHNRYNSPHGWFYRTDTAYSTPFIKGNLSLKYIRNQERTRTGRSLDEIADLKINQQITKESNVLLETNYNKKEDSYQEQRFLDVKLKVDTKLKPVDLNFLYQRKIPIKTGPYFRGITTDRTPFLECVTNTERIFGSPEQEKGLAYFVPLELKTSYGQFFDIKGSKSFSVYRSGISLQTDKFYEKGATKVDWRAKYDQRVYSDQTAQYVLDFNSGYRYKLSSDTEANIRYNYTHPYGYTPLSIDRVGRVNRFTTNVGFNAHPELLFTAHTGYDFLLAKSKENQANRSPWLPLRVGATWTPDPFLKFELNSMYDSHLKKWTGQTLLGTWNTSGGQIAGGARYDSIRKKWSSIGFYAKSIEWGHTRLGTLVRYNGYTKKLTETHLKVIYSLHCMEAAFHIGKRFTGVKPGVEYGFYVYLKAAPYQVPDVLERYGEARTLLDYYD